MVIAFAVVIGLAFLVGGPILVYFNQTYPELRASIVLSKDLFVGFFSVAGIFLAVENLRRGALAARTGVALKLVEKWNSMNWKPWHDLQHELVSLPANQVSAAILGHHEEVVAMPLNFMEEIAVAINSKSADEKQIWLAVGPTMLEYHAVLSPWIEAYRSKNARVHAWTEIEQLMRRWTKSPPR